MADEVFNGIGATIETEDDPSTASLHFIRPIVLADEEDLMSPGHSENERINLTEEESWNLCCLLLTESSSLSDLKPASDYPLNTRLMHKYIFYFEGYEWCLMMVNKVHSNGSYRLQSVAEPNLFRNNVALTKPNHGREKKMFVLLSKQ